MFDQLVITLYLLLTLLIGIYFRGKDSSSTKFLIFSEELRNNNFILMASIFATAVGAGTIFGLTSKIFLGDVSYAFGLIISIIADLLVIFFLIPKIVRFKKHPNIGNIVEKYYGTLGKIIYGIAVILVSLGYLSAQIKVSSEIFGHFTGISNIYGVIISYIIVIIYTTIGGLRSVILTDVMQFFFMLISIPYIAFCCIKFSGGTEFLIHQVTYSHNLLVDSIALAFSFSIMSINPTYLHRILVSGNARHAQFSSYVKSCIYLLFILMIVIIGFYAKGNITSGGGNQILTELINEIIPVGLKGLVFCGILGALMSTADSNLHIASVSFIYDVVTPIFSFSNFYQIIITRGFTILFGIGAIFLALKFENVIDLVIFMSGFWGAIIFAPLIFMFYEIYIKKWQFCASIACGISGLIYAEFFLYDWMIKPSLVAASLNFLVFGVFYIINKNFSR
jgi:SSS family solute:Na+ symporter